MEHAMQQEMGRQEHAPSGGSNRNAVLRSVVQDAQAALSAARQSFQEIPFDQLAKDASESIKSAAGSVSKFAADTANDLKQSEVVKDATERIRSASVGFSEYAKEAVGELKNLKMPFYSDAHVSPTSGAGSTENAATQTTEGGAAVQAMDKEQKWADELKTIRNILPKVDTAAAIERLEQMNGDVEAVVNSFMEE
uniref:CUE domain-containing protein n=1 Tax=Globisporangium ultimum (strain ATCC 200006 / CBS 805.95 / DAOM BR144) TaxID=431595 RepID=K3WPZ5_GLOUD